MSERIVIDPEICNGRPVVAGTRIAVQSVLEFLALTREDIQACVGYASRLMGNAYSVEAVE